jgi:hypothetical protein
MPGWVTGAIEPPTYSNVVLAVGDSVKIRAYSNVNSTPLSSESNFFLSEIAGFQTLPAPSPL